MLLSHGIAAIFLVDEALAVAPLAMWTCWIGAAAAWLTYLMLVTGYIEPGALPVGGPTFAKELASVDPSVARQLVLLRRHSHAYGLMPLVDRRADGTPDGHCTHCQLQRPLRAGHCKATGRCYARFDHSCWWVGQPVAAGNHRVFVLFVGAMVVQLCAGGNALWHLMRWPGLSQTVAGPIAWVIITMAKLVLASEEEDSSGAAHQVNGHIATLPSYIVQDDSTGMQRLPQDWLLRGIISPQTYGWLRLCAAVYVALLVLLFGVFVCLLLVEQSFNIATDQTVREGLKGRAGGAGGLGHMRGVHLRDEQQQWSGVRTSEPPSTLSSSQGPVAVVSKATLAGSKWARDYERTSMDARSNCLRFWTTGM